MVLKIESKGIGLLPVFKNTPTTSKTAVIAGKLQRKFAN
jgi:hypothetical protein